MNDHLKQRLPDLLGAAMAIGIGIWAWWLAAHYNMGSLRAMGPGYYPRMVAIALIGLGVLLALTSLRGAGGPGMSGQRAPLSSVLLIAAALISFALLIQRLGMFPAIFTAVLLSTFASDNRNILRSILLSAVTAGFCVVLFIFALGLPIKVFSL